MINVSREIIVPDGGTFGGSQTRLNVMIIAAGAGVGGGETESVVRNGTGREREGECGEALSSSVPSWRQSGALGEKDRAVRTVVPSKARANKEREKFVHALRDL